MKNHPSTNDIEAGGEKAKALRLADGKCELCGTTFALTYHHIIPRAEGGLNAQENFMVLCRTCHNEIEGLGYQSHAEIKRHTPAARVFSAAPVSEIRRDDAEERKAQKARAEREKAEEVAEWATKWGEGFWKHVPYVRLGDPVPKTPEWCLRVYGGMRDRR